MDSACVRPYTAIPWLYEEYSLYTACTPRIWPVLAVQACIGPVLGIYPIYPDIGVYRVDRVFGVFGVHRVDRVFGSIGCLSGPYAVAPCVQRYVAVQAHIPPVSPLYRPNTASIHTTDPIEGSGGPRAPIAFGRATRPRTRPCARKARPRARCGRVRARNHTAQAMHAHWINGGPSHAVHSMIHAVHSMDTGLYSMDTACVQHGYSMLAAWIRRSASDGSDGAIRRIRRSASHGSDGSIRRIHPDSMLNTRC